MTISKIEFNYRKNAEKFFMKHEEIRESFKRNIVRKEFLDDKNVDIKKMASYKDLYRMRIGSYRVIYKVEREEIVIIDVQNAGSRGDIYKKY